MNFTVHMITPLHFLFWFSQEYHISYFIISIFKFSIFFNFPSQSIKNFMFLFPKFLSIFWPKSKSMKNIFYFYLLIQVMVGGLQQGSANLSSDEPDHNYFMLSRLYILYCSHSTLHYSMKVVIDNIRWNKND